MKKILSIFMVLALSINAFAQQSESAEKKHIEGGIKPDFEAEIGDDYKTTRKDGVVEKALEELIKKI